MGHIEGRMDQIRPTKSINSCILLCRPFPPISA